MKQNNGSHRGGTTPAPGDLADRNFTAERPNEKWLTDITGVKAGDGKGVPLAAGRLTRWRDRRVCGRFRMLVRAAETLPEGAHPLVRSDRGCHCRWPGWLAFMDRYGLIRSTGAKGCSPDNAAAEGFFGRMKTESVHPEHWEERTRDEVLALIDDCIRWCNHERIKRSLGWMGPVQYRQSQGMAA